MLPTSLKIRFDGKRVKIRAENKSIAEQFNQEVIRESVSKLRRLLMEVYLSNPIDYKDYIEELFNVLVRNINPETGIVDLYILLEPDDVATNFFMNVGARKVTLSMRPVIKSFSSIANIINSIPAKVRADSGLVIKTNSDDSLNEFSAIIKDLRFPDKILEIYFDEIGLRLLKPILDLFDKLVSIRLLGRGNKVLINIHQKSLGIIDLRGLTKVDTDSLISFIYTLKELSDKICHLHLETEAYLTRLNDLLIEIMKRITPIHCVDVLISQTENRFDLKIMHESAIFRLNFAEEMFDRIESDLDPVIPIINKVLRSNIFIDIFLNKEKAGYRVLPKEEERKSSIDNWLRDVEQAINDFLKLRGMM